jgi:hypothetical protein
VVAVVAVVASAAWVASEALAAVVALVAVSALLACDAFGTVTVSFNLRTVTAPFLILELVTAPSLSCLVPTLSLPSFTPAYAVPPSAAMSAITDRTEPRSVGAAERYACGSPPVR